MGTWITQTTVDGAPDEVLAVLTDPEACTRWSPIAFEVDDLDGRLAGGTHTRVAGRLAGREIGFNLEVLEAGEDRFALKARGPIEIDVDYRVRPLDDRSHVEARVEVRPRGGLAGRLLSRATDALLAGGMLDHAAREDRSRGTRPRGRGLVPRPG
ncbi:MAG TPA: SRPBCC family protein [Solirubrobacteraceae bacterium]|nr:SRPBCC family protein [Solirubrobacteraceae bacterium]